MKKILFPIFFFLIPLLMLGQANHAPDLVQYLRKGDYRGAATVLKENASDSKALDQLIETLPDDEQVIRQLATDLYQLQEYDVAIKVFLQGRKISGNNQQFTFELLSLYRFKRDKPLLIQEFINALSTMPQMLVQAQTVLSSVLEGNADYTLLQTALLRKIQKDPQNESYTALLIWQYLQQQEYDMALNQLLAEDKRTKGDGSRLFESVQVFTANKAYATAIRAYAYLLLKGKDSPWYLPSRMGLADVSYQSVLAGQIDAKEVAAAAAQYRAILDEYGTHVSTLFALRRWANLQAYYLHHLQVAEEALEGAISMPGIPATDLADVKLELADVYVLTAQPWEAILLYGQVATTYEGQGIGNEAKYRSARLSFYQGNFTYAKSQADVLKASTTQLIANDALNLSLLLSDHLESTTDTLALKLFAAAEFMQFRNLLPEALNKLDSIAVRYPQNTLSDNILMAKSRINTKMGNYSQSAALLESLIARPQTNLWVDDALFLLAGLYEEQLHQPEKAKALYQQLITNFPGSMFTAEARKHFRKLRGDNIES